MAENPPPPPLNPSAPPPPPNGVGKNGFGDEFPFPPCPTTIVYVCPALSVDVAVAYPPPAQSPGCNPLPQS